MRFIKLLGTFKNGLISPRLRGTVQNEQEVFNSAEELKNFYIDKVGAANKRGGIGETLTHDIGLSIAGRQYFEFVILGTRYLFVFDHDAFFNQVDVSYNSVFLKIYIVDPLGVYNPALQLPVKVLTGHPTSYIPPTNRNLSFYNGQYSTAGNFIDSGLTYLLTRNTGQILNHVKTTDRTVMFTTSGGVPFSVSLLDKYSNSTTFLREFVMLPNFVSLPLFIQSYFDTALVPISSKCFIVPTNYPLNSINSNTAITVNFAQLTDGGGNPQQGSAPADGVVANHNERIVWRATFSVGMANLLGRFIVVPNAASTRDVVFFITKAESSTQFLCLQVVGGTPLGATSLWKLSTWGYGVGQPLAVGFCFGRLMYGNTVSEASKWWASATHPDQIEYFQGFLQDNLRQDATSDVSGLMYSDVTAGDPLRFGFSDYTPNGSAISWIKSRRRVHLGTIEGETQIEVDSGGFDLVSHAQLVVGTNSAYPAQAVEGDRKIFYIDGNRRDIRYISTEDRDYESVDGLVTTLIEGLGIQIIKLGWYEEENILFFSAIKSDNSIGLYGVCLHSDTQIKAVFEVEFDGIDILDFTTTYKGVNVAFNESGNTICCVFNIVKDPYLNKPTFFDFCETYPSAAGGLGNSPLYANREISIYFNGVLYENFQTGNAYPYFHTSTGADPLPFNLGDTSIDNPAYFFLSTITARIKTMPFNEGSQLGSAVGSIHRVDRVTFQVDNSGPFSAGESYDNMHPIEGLDNTPRTGLYRQDFPQSPDVERVLCIESTTPTPLHISGVSLRGVSYEGD